MFIIYIVIDIANNNLEGELPASVGDMSELVSKYPSISFSACLVYTLLFYLFALSYIALKMDNNNFSGLIPEELGEIETLRSK